MKALNRWLDKLDYSLALIGGCTIFLMMVWIVSDVFFRTVFDRPIAGTIEITGEYFMVCIVYLSLSYIFKVDGHVSVDFLKNKFSKRIKKINRLISNLLSLIIFVILGVTNFNLGMDYFTNDIRSVSLLHYPLAPAIMVISLGIFVLSIRIIVDSINVIKNEKEL